MSPKGVPLTEKKVSVPLWLVALLFTGGTGTAVVGGVMGVGEDKASNPTLEAKIAVLEGRQDQVEKRLERIEDKVDKVLDRLPRRKIDE